MMLHILSYFSAAASQFRYPDLRDIIDISVANNKKLGVTGLLCYRERNFLQFLEGEKDVVEELYDKIKQDPRHTGVSTMLSEPIEKRVFDKWYMALRNVDDFEAEEKDVLLELFRVNLDRKIDGHVRLVELLLDVFRQRPLK
jgi:hypothetical protein